MPSPKISVIVPVYNAGKWLQRCIDSILAQTFTDFELLLIDDGSTDNSGAICDEYAEQDSRIRVFHKPNGGVSSARNLGLDNARGEWITFVDSDDWIISAYLSSLLGDEEVDFAMLNYQAVGWKGWINKEYENRVYSENELPQFFVSHLISCNTPWAKVFKCSIIKKNYIRFDEALSYGEDTLFVIDYLMHVEKVRIINNKYYYYNCENLNSLSNKIDVNRCLDLVDSLSERIIALGSIKNFDYLKVKNSIIRLISNRIIYSFDYYQDNAPSKLKKICQNNNLNDVIEDKSLPKSLSRKLFEYLSSKQLYSLIVFIMRLKNGRQK